LEAKFWEKFGPVKNGVHADFGYKIEDNNSLNTDFFKTYFDANTSCNEEWDGAGMAIMPSREHNAMIAALLGPFYFGSDAWIGIYNWAYRDSYFSLDNKDRLTYSNWAPGSPEHVQASEEKCGIIKWRSEFGIDQYRLGCRTGLVVTRRLATKTDRISGFVRAGLIFCGCRLITHVTSPCV